MAITSKMWMNPPSVYEETIPSSQRINRITNIVQSMAHSLSIYGRETLGAWSLLHLLCQFQKWFVLCVTAPQRDELTCDGDLQTARGAKRQSIAVLLQRGGGARFIVAASPADYVNTCSP
jgi:hypothetical protein